MPKERSSQSKNWLFTVNNFTSEDENIFKDLECNYLIFGHEIGEKGTPHLQGYVQMNVNKRMTGMKKNHKTAHWEIARGSAQQNRVYCSKDHNDIFEKGNMITERRGKVDALLKSIREGMKAGGVGKTTLAKYLKCVKGAAVFMNGKSADIAHAYNCEKIVVFDFARCMQEFVNYSIIEAIKNGLIFSPKYESKSLQFKEPAVIVFANDVPCLKQLSEDRWNLMTIENEQLIKLHVNYVDHECKHCKK
ncbi:MREP-like protein [Mya arenaria]|uniref:MREP-like protein n=1 Tax=Mya arenaria TaxID=6604 RepID=A0ABY7FYH4_MYAAR|nr:MREP-like protein [Mya arenaria]